LLKYTPMNSFTEENYLKAIYKLMEQSDEAVSTNAIAEKLNTKAATVTDMLKKLSAKKLVNYTKYKGVSLSAGGTKIAVGIIRKHRLWEFFLVEQLHFRWNEVHEIAEQLEHIQSAELVERLSTFLGNPKYDPHGDPIPDENGRITNSRSLSLDLAAEGKKYRMTGVVDHKDLFLKHLDELGFCLGCDILIKEIREYDHSLQIKLNRNRSIYISHEVAKNILITEDKRHE
jgi:DtxR family Mn-dependent transcriptional regulator